MKKYKNKSLSYLGVIVVLIIYLFYSNGVKKHKIDILSEDGLKVCFVDVGQGDCSVIVFPDNRVMMVDAGDNSYEERIYDFLDYNGIKKIDYLIATHPHSDHIGGMSEIIDRYEIGNFYMPKVTHTSKTFSDMIDSLQKKNLKINTARAGKVIVDDGGIYAEFLSPTKDKYEDLNNYSSAVRLSYKGKAVLLCGDIEREVEDEILNSGAELQADVLKVAHHGSSTSSSKKFLDSVNCRYALISCGKNNDYGHPHKEVINRLKKMPCEIYNTSVNGDVLFIINDDINIEY